MKQDLSLRRTVEGISRVAAILVAFATTAFAAAQTHLAVSVRNHPAGFATLNQRIQKDGIKVVELRMEFSSGGQKVNITSEARYDSKGLPTRKFQQIQMAALNKQVIVTFGKDGANVVLLDGDKRSVKNVPLSQSAQRASMSEFWFIRDKPKAGQVEEAYQFNMDTLKWEIVTTEYRGKKTLKIEGRSVPVHEIVTKRGDKETTAYLDDQGLPVLVDQGDTKMVKIWGK